MEITHNKLLNNFLPAFIQLGDIKTANSKLRYAIKKTAPAIDAAVEIFNAVNKEKLELVASKDEKGNVVFDDNGAPLFPSEDVKDTFYKEFNDFNETVITVIVHGVLASDLDGIAISSFTERNLGEFIIDEEVMKAV